MGSRTYLSCLVGIYAWDLLALLKTERRLVWRVSCVVPVDCERELIRFLFQNKHWSLLNYLFLVKCVIYSISRLLSSILNDY